MATRMRWITFDCFGTLVNWQAGFAIDGGLSREEYDALRAGMKRNAIWGHSDGIDAVHLFRLPQGSHTKREPAWRIAA